MSRRIVFAGGGTAGHAEPALATADALRERQPDWNLTFLGTAAGIEARLVPARGYHLDLLPKVPLPRRIGTDVVTLPIRLVQAVRRARAIVRGADCVVGFGGYVSVPAYLAARMLRVPIVVHEQNARAGIGNRIGARWAKRTGSTFAESGIATARVIGLPMRAALLEVSTQLAQNREKTRAVARAHWGFSDSAPLLLVTGGSQGSARINAALEGALPQLLGSGWQILHAVGERNPVPVAQPGYFPVGYIDTMELALAASDLLVGRSGAGTCAETAALGVPAIFVPLPIGNGEQALNAQEAIAAGGALLLPDSECTAATLVERVTSCRKNLESMRNALMGIAHTDAADTLAQMIESVVLDRPSHE